MRPVAADELIKKVPPYRPPGAVVPSSINTLVNPLVGVDMPGSKHISDDVYPITIPGKGPFFDIRVTRNVTALAGKTTHLVCRVKRLRNNTVSL